MLGRKPIPLLDRFVKYIELTETGCWFWTGAKDNDGYGVIKVRFGTNNRRNQRAHRVAFELFKEDIPMGLVIDHQCRNKSCVNPNHLRLFTPLQNADAGCVVEHRNKTHCKHGHAFTKENTYIRKTPSGSDGRCCRICARERAYLQFLKTRYQGGKQRRTLPDAVYQPRNQSP